MVIHRDSHLTTPGGPLNAALPQTTPPPKRGDGSVQTGSREDDRATIASRGSDLPSSVPPISDEVRAQEIANLARFHILSQPAAVISVQANSRPQAVLELLDGILG
ncbi:MAG: hypothetical protein HY735_37675 [Verrucomicrobia bacterium]|nr:hypothetical protein [Verrucomicrobiota bacterium]